MEKTSDCTSVHTIETTGTSPVSTNYQDYRRSLCATEFSAAQLLYSNIDLSEGGNREGQLLECRQYASFVQNKETGKVHVASNSCRLRWCPICAKSRSAYITRSVRSWLSKVRTARFLTLTLKHSNAPLATQITKLYDDFRKLRRHKQFRKYCHSGVWFFQVKLSKDGEQWHPHLHCVILGKYIPHDWLSKLWLRITKSSNIIDIRLVKNHDKMASYVARYSARPADLSSFPPFLQMEMFKAMHGRRLCGSWGVSGGLSLSPPRKLDESKFNNLGSFSKIMSLFESEPKAKEIFVAWITGSSLPKHFQLFTVDYLLSPTRPDYEIEQSLFDSS
jgi:hypothetical protein